MCVWKVRARVCLPICLCLFMQVRVLWVGGLCGISVVVAVAVGSGSLLFLHQLLEMQTQTKGHGYCGEREGR